MNSLHSKILNLLHEIDDICRRYNITYYAAGGTTIGAIRHKGFIPWDDDADIYMTRDNFYKFREAFNIEKPQNRVLGCLDDNSEYPGTIPRYVDDTSSLVAKYHVLNTCAAGVLIDIFILDPVPDDEEIINNHIGKLNIYADLVMPYYGYTHRADDKYLDEYNIYMNKVKQYGRDKVISELENELFSYDEKDCECYILRWGTLTWVFKKNLFDEPVYFDFEDMKVPCPGNWYDYLTQLYGPKWMYIPPHSDDGTHDFIVDINRKYTNYLVDAERFIDKEEARITYAERKSLFVKREKLMRPFRNEILRLKARYILRSQDKYIQSNCIDIKKLYDCGRYDDVVEAYQIYMKMQFNFHFVGRASHAGTYRYNHKIFIGLPDEQLELLVRSLYMQGNLKRAMDLLNLRQKANPMSADLEDILNKVINGYEIYKLFYIGKYDEVENIINSLPEEEKNIVDFKKIKLQILLHNNESVTEDEIRSLIDEKHPDSEYIKILGDYFWQKGKLDEAASCYRTAAPALENGLMLLDINEKCGIETDFSVSNNINVRTELQEKQYQLLKEIDSICDKYNIDYVLSGNTLLNGYYYNVFGDEYKTNTIIMTPEAALRFIEVCNIELPDNRSIDYMLNNPMHNGHTIYYCDKDTLSIDMRKMKASENIGIHITIYILKKKDKNIFRWFTVRCLDAAQTLYERGMNGRKYNGKLHRYYWIGCMITSAIGRRRIRKYIFNGYINGALKNDGNYYLSKNNYRRSISKYYKKEYFSNCSYVKIYDYEFRAPCNVEDYIRDIHGKYAQEKVIIRNSELPLFKYADVNLSYEDIKDIIPEEEIERRLWDDYRRGSELTPEINKLNKRTRKYWNILLRSEDRIRLYEQYMPLKDEIIENFNQNKYDTVERMLQDYDKAVRDNMRKGLALSFDNDIFDVYCKLLRHNGEKDFADKLEEALPEEYKTKMLIQ